MRFRQATTDPERPMALVPTICAIVAVLSLCGTASVQAQLDFEQEPINYSDSQPHDRITRLQERLAAGTASLNRDEEHGYLKSLLAELEIPVSSQVLVFSKTSFQRHRISPRTPRAVYFNDDTYIGWVQRGDVIEVSTADPTLGAVFYTLDQEPSDEGPAIQRQIDRCIICHASTHTRRVPGHIVRSVYPDRGGMPVFSAGTFRTDHTSPLEERWGGWYVSGTHGDQRHMGNVSVSSKIRAEQSLDVEAGANVEELSTLFRTDPYLSSHSDIVALMVLEHQVAMQNILTDAGISGRRTIYDAAIMNKALERDEDYVSDTTTRRFDSAAKKVIDGLLFVGEASLTAPVQGTSTFADDFMARGPFDEHGRSLRQLDLQTRMFRYPCSYLIHSDAFNALPEPVLEIVYQKLLDVLSGEDSDERFAHLTAADRQAILEILRETKPEFANYAAARSGLAVSHREFRK